MKFGQPVYTMRYRGTLQLSAAGTNLSYSTDSTRVQVGAGTGKVTSLKAGWLGFFKAATSATVTATDGITSDTCTVQVKTEWWQWLIAIFLFGWLWY